MQSRGREGPWKSWHNFNYLEFHLPTLYPMLRIVTECIAGPSRLPLRPLIARSCNQHIRPQSRALSSTPIASSGHNRWSKIRHKKGAVDAQRSAIFSRLTNVRPFPYNQIHLQDCLYIKKRTEDRRGIGWLVRKSINQWNPPSHPTQMQTPA